MSFDPDAIRAFEHRGWQSAAQRYGGTFAAATAPFIEPLLDAAGIAAGMRVLDVACGPGYVAAEAAARGAAATGLDFSSAMVAVARREHPDLRIDEGDAEDLPYPDGAFDAVVSNFGIHHAPRPTVALREARRVLRPGGRVAFTIWAEPVANLAWKLVFDAIERHGDRSAAKAPPPQGGFSRAEDCRRALDDAGFAAVDTELPRASWRLSGAAALLDALRQGTVRMAGLIGAQDPAAMPAITAEIERSAAAFRTPGALEIPIAAIVARAVRP